jgi:hypothetical protein
MPHWLIKSGIQRLIATLPARQRWNALFQKLGTRSLSLSPEMFELRVDQCRKHLEGFFEFCSNSIGQFTVLELGTGWFPTLAIGMYLCGAKEIWTYDIDPLLESSRLRLLLNYFRDYAERGELVKRLPRLLPERLERLTAALGGADSETAEQTLGRFNIHAAVRDAQDTDLPPESIDFVFSHGVLEYIPTAVLTNILREFKRVAVPTAVASHYIDLTDQYHYFDRKITPLNFLKYSSRTWRYLNSPLIWQSRLRISDYRDLFRTTGWEIMRETNSSAEESTLKQLSLAPEFAKYSSKDLLVTKSWITAKCAGRNEDTRLNSTFTSGQA